MEEIDFISSHGGQTLSIAGSMYRVLIDGKQTAGRYAIIEMNVPPGGGPLPHAHKNMEEIFYVAEGAVQFRSETNSFIAKVGDTIRISMGGAVHAFKNVSGNNARLICTALPAGLEDMFREIQHAAPSEAKGIAEKYGNQLYPGDYFDSKKI